MPLGLPGKAANVMHLSQKTGYICDGKGFRIKGAWHIDFIDVINLPRFSQAGFFIWQGLHVNEHYPLWNQY